MRKMILLFSIGIILCACEINEPDNSTAERTISHTEDFFPEPSVDWWECSERITEQMLEKGYKFVEENNQGKEAYLYFYHRGYNAICAFEHDEYIFAIVDPVTTERLQTICKRYLNDKNFIKEKEGDIDSGSTHAILFSINDKNNFVFINWGKDKGGGNIYWGSTNCSLYENIADDMMK